MGVLGLRRLLIALVEEVLWLLRTVVLAIVVGVGAGGGPTARGAHIGEGVGLADTKAGIGGSGAFGFEGGLFVLVGGFGFLEDVDDVLALFWRGSMSAPTRLRYYRDRGGCDSWARLIC